MTEPTRQVVHIGLAKTGTTTLQKHVFPMIAQLAGYAYNPPQLSERLTKFLITYDPEDRRKVAELAGTHPRLFVSNESQATWLPQHFEKAAEGLLLLWGRHTTILITLRDPVDFQSSLYAGSFRAGAYLRPRDFFLSAEHHARVGPPEGHWLDDFFDVDAFDFQRLVEIYRERFDHVVVLPLETQFDLHALARVFDLDDEQRRVVAKHLASVPRLNTRPAAWEIRVLSLYVKLTGKQMRSPGLGTKIRSVAPRRAPTRLLNARHWWLRLRSILYRLLPNTPYQLPADTYQNAELTRRNRAFLAELAAEDRASRPGPARG